MPRIKPNIETFAKIKVVGVGGSGSNAIDHMIERRIQGVDFIAINTDAQDLHHSRAPIKIHIGKNLTHGLGAGMNPDVGQAAAEESKEEIQEALKGADMVFIAGGFGGGTCSGAAPAVADIAKDAGALAVAVITRPFSFEGTQRRKIADEAFTRMENHVDTLISIHNDKLLALIDKKTPLLNAFAIVDEVLLQAVQGISDIITLPGIVNVDFADVKAIIGDAGTALLGIGKASGEERALEAAKAAINSPLLDISIEGAKGLLFNVSGGPDLAMYEINDAAKIITESIDKEAKVIFGAVEDPRLKKGEIKITVIATGFGAKSGNSDKESGKSNFNPVIKTVSTVESFFAPKSQNQSQNPENQAKKNEEKKEESDEWDIPAFLRRKK